MANSNSLNCHVSHKQILLGGGEKGGGCLSDHFLTGFGVLLNLKMGTTAELVVVAAGRNSLPHL